MSIIVNGFNRFNQLHCLHLGLQQAISSESYTKESTLVNNVNLVSNFKSSVYELSVMMNNSDHHLSVNFNCLFSWSYCLFYNRETFWLCGFLDGKSNSIKSLKAPNGKTILQSSCNRKQLLCVTEDGCCWQYNIESGLWRNLTPILHSEMVDEESSQVIISKVCCGELVTAVLTSKGEVFNLPNKLNLPGVKVKDISCGRAHILMLSDKGEVFSVGEGSRGQLGHGDLEAEEEPRLVEGLAGLVVVAVACGSWHSCAVTADGDLYTWGWNMCGQLGLQTSKAGSGVSVQALPVAVDFPNNQDVRVCSVACGARHTVTLTEVGDVWACGWNGYGQLSLPGVDSVDEMTRIAVPEERLVRRVVCGPWNTCLVT